MAANIFWGNCSNLTVEQAVWLMLDIDPPTQIGPFSIHQPTGFDPLFVALTATIKKGGLRATYCGIQIGDQPYGASVNPDWRKTYVDTEDLKIWMRSIGLTPRVFFPNDSVAASGDFSDVDKKYPEKLRAALEVYIAVRKVWNSASGKTPKQALTDWLERNAKQYGLVHPDGSLNKKGIEEVVSVANWEPKGGAPKTPHGDHSTH